jgi:uncharacterized protein GlcG (DUF336 family)
VARTPQLAYFSSLRVFTFLNFIVDELCYIVGHDSRTRLLRGHMPNKYTSLTLDDAKKMAAAAEAKARSMGIAYCIAVVDAGGHLIAFLRQDGALIGSIDLAIDKAVTARLFDKTTLELSSLAQSGRPLFGIQESNAGTVVIFGGGIPVWSEVAVIGAVGASSGTVEQDVAVAEAAIAGLDLSTELFNRKRGMQT